MRARSLIHLFLPKAAPGKEIPIFEQLLDETAAACEGFSGASLAGVARAAASHALERAVTGFSAAANGEDRATAQSMLDCLVTQDDLHLAIKDVLASSGEDDWAEDEATAETSDVGDAVQEPPVEDK